MKRILILIIGILNCNQYVFAADCSSYKSNLDSINTQISSLETQSKNILSDTEAAHPWITTGMLYEVANEQQQPITDKLNLLYNSLYKANSDYNSCIATQQSELSSIFNNWYNAIKSWDYQSAISYFNQYLSRINSSDSNYSSAQNNLKISYNALAWVYFAKGNFNNAISNYKLALQIDNRDSNTLTNIWACYSNLLDFDNAINYYNQAYSYATDTDSINDIKVRLQKAKDAKTSTELKKDAPTNDPLSGYQYYLKDLNIPSAWKKVTNSNQVIVAVIDDWININHPDFVNNIWVNPNAKYGSSKIIDFVWDWMPANLPVWDHWTMIAWIIWAIQNNNEWIAWIAKNVKLMPLRVFDTKWWASENNIIKAMNYAIDNGANIINLSLWWSQFAYSDKYDSVIKRAYDKWVIIVIAAWNWDILSWQQNWINLDVNPISPVCNNGGNYDKYSIWVRASDKEWYRTNWTNYWNCTSFMAPWVWIVSTSIPAYNETYWTNYNIKDWTSFSAPIVSWIIALWYNQYWYISPSLVSDSLFASLTKNSIWNYYIDASKYLDILWTKINQIKQDQQTHSETINTLNSLNSTASNWDILANAWIITKRDNQEDYRVNDFVLRQEVVWMGIKVMGKNLMDWYSCRNIFKDVSTAKPNDWACRAIETSADSWIVSTKNKSFRPEDKITRAEALAIIMKAANINWSDIVLSSYSDVNVDWQIKLVNKALDLGIIDKTTNFRPNENATRWEIFDMTKRILKTK